VNYLFGLGPPTRETRCRATLGLGRLYAVRYPLRLFVLLWGTSHGRLRPDQARLMASPGIVILPPHEGLVRSKLEKLRGANIGSNLGTTSPCEASKNQLTRFLNHWRPPEVSFMLLLFQKKQN